jgi:hypothetical protein
MIGVVLFYARTGQVCKFGVALLCRIIVALRMGYSATHVLFCYAVASAQSYAD